MQKDSQKNKPVTCNICGGILLKLKGEEDLVVMVVRCGICKSEQKITVERITNVKVETI